MAQAKKKVKKLTLRQALDKVRKPAGNSMNPDKKVRNMPVVTSPAYKSRMPTPSLYDSVKYPVTRTRSSAKRKPKGKSTLI